MSWADIFRFSTPNEGDTKWDTCWRCHGKGQTKIPIVKENEIDTVKDTCPECRGRGELFYEYKNGEWVQAA